MTELLKKAFEEASKLPEKDQEMFASFLLAELESERRWVDLFARSQDMLSEMADEALREHRAGLTRELVPEDL